MAPLQNRMRPDPITVDQGAINGAPTKTVCAPESDNRGAERHEWRPYKKPYAPGSNNRMGQSAGAAVGGALMRPGIR